MTHWTAYSVGGLALVLAIYAGWRSYRQRPADRTLLYAVVAMEVILLVQLVAGIIALSRPHHHVDGLIFVAYLVSQVIIPPAAYWWGRSDPSRWGSAVVAVAMFTVGILSLRLLQIWSGRA